MERLQFIRPRLIEPGVKYFINTTLEQCQMLKVKYYNFLYNLGLLVLFAGILSIFLYYKYKQKNDRLAQQEKKGNNKNILLTNCDLCRTIEKIK